MVTAAEIRDEASLRAWLEGRPTAVSLRLAHCRAAKSLPVVESRLHRYMGAPQFERDSATAALAVIRLNLVLQLITFRPGAIPLDRLISLVDSAEQQWLSTEDIFDPVVGSSLLPPIYGLVSAILTELPDAHFADEDPTTLFRFRTSFDALISLLRASTLSPEAEWSLPTKTDPAVFEALSADLAAAMSNRPLAMALPEAMKQFWPTAREIWRARGAAWDFWIDWYEDMLSGREPDWALQEKVALIPDEVWQQGAGAVAAEIARIEEQLRLLREVERLKEHLASARSEIAALSRRGHNNPPELVEPVAEIERQASEISKALEDAAQELKSDAPRPSVLRRVGGVLLEVAVKSLSYCISLGDVAAKKAAEELGAAGTKAVVGAGFLAWVAQLDAVQNFARALGAFAKLLGGG